MPLYQDPQPQTGTGNWVRATSPTLTAISFPFATKLLDTADGTLKVQNAAGSNAFTAAATSVGSVSFSGAVKTVSTVVASLPAAATAGAGARAFVTDGSTTVILGLGLTVTGGGANKVPVYSDGTNWIVG